MIEKIVQTAKHTVKATVLMLSAMPRPCGAGPCTVVENCIRTLPAVALRTTSLHHPRSCGQID
jgi:hypothetical protein